MKKIILSLLVLFLTFFDVFGQRLTYLVKTNQKFENKEFVYDVMYMGKRVGEFWPVDMLNFVTKQTDSLLFTYPLDSLQKKLKGIAMAPDGMTSGSIGTYVMEGKALSHGRPCGDGIVYNYGIIVIDAEGYITFTHKLEISDFEEFYQQQKLSQSSLLFLPSIYRNGKYLSSTNAIEKVLVRRDTYDGIQISIVIFDQLTSYDNVRQIILGLDRDGESLTTHIYVLDGGPTWGQCSKKVNGGIINLGTRDISKVTNYLVVY